MLIPDFQTIMLPLLEGLKDDEVHAIDAIADRLAAYFELTEEALNTQVKNEGQTLLLTNILEAIAHLKKSGLLEQSVVGFKITSMGRQIVNRRLNGIDVQYLRRLPGYLD